MSPGDWALLVVLSICWGGSFFFIELALDGFSPLTLVFGRLSTASAVLWIYVQSIGGRFPKSARVWGMFAVMGLVGNAVPFSLISWGQLHIDGGLASILNAPVPLFTAVLAYRFARDERLSAGRGFGIVLGFAAIIVMVGPHFLLGFDAQGLGQLAVLAGAFSYAVASIYGRRLSELPVSVVSAGVLTMAAVIMLPPTLIFDAPWQLRPDLMALAALGGLALISTVGAYLIFFRLLERTGATNVSLVTFLIPVSALILGGVFLGERLDWWAFAGMALLFTGLAIVDGRLVASIAAKRVANKKGGS